MVEITLLTTGQVFDCSENDTILRAALRNGIGMTYSCNVGSCGNCKFEVVEGSVTHLRSDAPASSERDLARNRYLGCQAVPNGPCSIKIRTDPAAMPVHKPLKFRVKVLSKQYLTRDIC
jgi:toluene monooxygenase electron transfer component